MCFSEIVFLGISQRSRGLNQVEVVKEICLTQSIDCTIFFSIQLATYINTKPQVDNMLPERFCSIRSTRQEHRKISFQNEKITGKVIIAVNRMSLEVAY